MFARGSRIQPWAAIALIVVIGVLARVGTILAIKAHHSDAGMYEHLEIASNLVQGRGFQFAFFADAPLPSSQQAPAVPSLLALCFFIAGENTPTAKLVYMLGVNVLLSAAGMVAIWQLGRRMRGDSLGLCAAAIFAVYPPLVYAATRIQAAIWSVCWLLVALAFAVEAMHRRSPRFAALAGAAAGCGMLGEPIMLFPAALVAIVMLWQLRTTVGGWRVVGATALAASLVLAPWTIRNAVVHHRLVFVKSTFWYAFWQGNHEQATGTDKLLPADAVREQLAWARGGASLEDVMNQARSQAISVDSHLSSDELAAIRALPTEVEKVDHFKRLSLRELVENPGHYVRLCLTRLGQMLWFDPTNPRAYVLSYRASYLLLASLSLVGIAISWRKPPLRQWQLPAAAVIALLIFHSLAITSARFRLPIEALIALPAGVTLATLCGWPTSRRSQATSTINPHHLNHNHFPQSTRAILPRDPSLNQ